MQPRPRRRTNSQYQRLAVSVLMMALVVSPAAAISAFAGTGTSRAWAAGPIGANAQSFSSLAVGDGSGDFRCEDGDCMKDFACAVRTPSHELTCWGYRGYDLTTPPSGRFRSVVTGDQIACAIRENRTLACWGSAANTTFRPPSGPFVSLNLGVDRTAACGVRPSGSLTCWGPLAPKPLSGPFTHVSVGTDGDRQHSSHDDACGLRPDGHAVCWGPDVGYGGWVTPPSTRSIASHVITIPGTRFRDIGVTDLAVCGLLVTGSVSCWNPAWGNAGPYPRGQFTQMSTGNDVSGFFCGLRPNGVAVCWGDNEHQAAQPPLGRFRLIAAGTSADCAIVKDNAEVWCWGSLRVHIRSS